mmetsp:Transcript_3795/g.6909  ORF Transcript_3795/g.6909 Transcript_3795/m.6909 type:complete len:84 (-) Transcript_3795:323-574(-)
MRDIAVGPDAAIQKEHAAPMLSKVWVEDVELEEVNPRGVLVEASASWAMAGQIIWDFVLVDVLRERFELNVETCKDDGRVSFG